jgi:hypothetical protein
MRAAPLFALLCLVPLEAVHGQTGGLITGRVVDVLNRAPVVGAVISIGREERGAITGSDGRYAVRDLRPGYHRVTVRAVGFQPIVRDSVLVRSGTAVELDFVLASEAIELPGVAIEAEPDRLLDPREPQTVQAITAEDLRFLPVTSLAEAIALQAGVVEGSIRGGRVGQEALLVDGLGVKNQLDAGDAALGVRIPTIALEEATLVSSGFSARYGQAVSGIVTASTRDGGERLEGRLAIETDRGLPTGWNTGLDRLTASLGGPVIGPIRFFVAFDAEARIDDDPVNAPPPTDPLDPRSQALSLLPHNSGERFDALAKLTIPLSQRVVLRVLGVGSESQQRLFDPELKYAAEQGPGQRLSGRLAMLHFRRASAPEARTTVVADLRMGYFEKEALRAPLAEPADLRFGGFAFSRFHFVGEELASARDTIAAHDAVSGFERPDYASNTPWGVPAFFMTASPRGELAWNRFREGRARFDLLVGPGADTDLRLGLEYVRQRVETFTRLESYRAVTDGAPPPTASAFSPFQGSAYLELQQRAGEITLTAGLRADVFNGRSTTEPSAAPTKLAMGPRLGVSTQLGPATVVVSWGRFAQPPDFQYLADAAFADTTRTGRFRRGNAALGFETSNQYEMQVRVRPSRRVGVRLGAFVKRLDGLVASIPLGLDPDSAIFASGDFGDVRGLELVVEREFDGVLGARVSYVLQQAEATATNARDLFRRLQIVPNGDTVYPASVAFPLDYDRRQTIVAILRARIPDGAGAVLAGTEGSLVFRWGSGLPYTMWNQTGDSLIGLPNSQRLESESTVDLLLRRSVRLGGLRLGVYADLRNLTNRQNVVAVRRDSGEPVATEGQILATAEEAYQAHPEPIPYESVRYRSWADQNGDGLLAGRQELLPLYERAARDRVQPLFYYGPPRLVRLGVEVSF